MSSTPPSTHSCKGIITEHQQVYEKSNFHMQVAELYEFSKLRESFTELMCVT